MKREIDSGKSAVSSAQLQVKLSMHRHRPPGAQSYRVQRQVPARRPLSLLFPRGGAENPCLPLRRWAFWYCLAAAGWFYRSGGRGGEAIDSVAVLPFVNASGDPNSGILERRDHREPDQQPVAVAALEGDVTRLRVSSTRERIRMLKPSGGSSGYEPFSKAGSPSRATIWRSARNSSTPATTTTSGASNTAGRLGHFRAARRHRQGNDDGTADASNR